MNKPILFFLTLIFLSIGYPAYSYSHILVCGNSTCGPAYNPPPFQGGGGYGYPANVTNITNETIVPAGPTGLAMYVSTFLNDASNLLVGFFITEEGPERIVIGRVVFFLILIVIVLMSLGTFFGYKKIKKYLAPKK
jgi:hypothetical protein